MTEHARPASREEWLAIRQSFTGASEIAALLRCHPWLTLTHLWALKAGRIDPEPENAAMRRGKYLESSALAMLAAERPDWTVTPNSIPGGFLAIDSAARICATPDAIAINPQKPGTGVIQIKSVDQWAFRRTWLNDAGDIEAPLHVLIQTATEMHLTGAAWGVVCALSIGSGIELHILDMPHIDGLMPKLVSANKDFWRLVEKGERPPADYGRDLALIASLNKAVADPGKTVDLSGDNAFSAAIADYLDASAIISAESKRKAAAEAEIRDKLGDAATATANDFVVTAKEVNRTEHTVKATSYRQLRVKDASA